MIQLLTGIRKKNLIQLYKISYFIFLLCMQPKEVKTQVVHLHLKVNIKPERNKGYF